MAVVGLMIGPVAVPAAALALAPAEGAAPTCRGLKATIVGTRATLDFDSPLRGTSGDDVVVTNGASLVTTGAGNDTICVTTAPTGEISGRWAVFPGTGDDVVDSSTLPRWAYLSTDVGEGSDVVTGGPGTEHVDACRGLAPDTVSTAGGNDWVRVCEKRSPDAIDTGEDDDTLLILDPQAPHGHLTAGPGANTLIFSGPWLIRSDTWGIDLAAKSSTFNTTNVSTWDDASEVIVLGTSATLTVRGTDGPDDLRLFGDLLGGQPAARATVDLAGGDDRLRVDIAAVAAGSSMDAGMGRDLLGASSSGRLEIDLHDETITGGRRTLPRSVTGFEDVRGQATRLTLTGNELNNTLRADACVAVTRGRGGDDDVTLGHRPWRRSWCPEGPRRAEGGVGDDRLTGGPDREYLSGGPGIDQINGGGGGDVCVGERRVQCKARRPSS
ncbi:hypothetical protein [Nocardioides sp. P5_E3]